MWSKVLEHQPNTIYMNNHYRKNDKRNATTQDFSGDNFLAFPKFGVL